MKIIKKYFSFSQGELYGILFLTIIIMFLSIYLLIDFDTINAQDYSSHVTEIESFIEKIETEKPEEQKSYTSSFTETNFEKTSNVLTPFTFDPNKMSKALGFKLGLSEKQTAIILNYLNKGGKFKTKEDFSKMYSISKEDYRILESYIEIEKEEIKFKNSYKSKPVFVIDFNVAMEDELINIPGIGQSFAKRIKKYQEKLGGYFDSTQLLEVFGMDSNKYRSLLPYFSCNMDSLKRKNVNKESFKEMIKHPYFSKSTAYLIIQYRQMHGEIKSTKDLRQALKNNDSIYRKVSPYIKF